MRRARRSRSTVEVGLVVVITVEDASAAQGKPGESRRARRPVEARDRAADQCSWRVNWQTGQVATFVSGSTTRKLVQPLVLQ
jgi:hypothetical protein